jgi:hypothetical protein
LARYQTTSRYSFQRSIRPKKSCNGRLLIEVGDAPAKGNVELEQVGESSGSLRRRRVSPSTKWHEQLSIFIEMSNSRASSR